MFDHRKVFEAAILSHLTRQFYLIKESGMESNHDPFNTNAWMHQYAALQEQQRARQKLDNKPAGQASFERQLSDLQLSSPDESSGDAGSPDTRSAVAHGSIQRTNVGGSMRMPPHSSLLDNSVSSTRYSVDIPRVHLGSAAKASQSDLRDRPFSSTRYTAPSEARLAARTKDSKSRGLFSRIKSGLGKAFGGSRHEKSSGDSLSYVIHSEPRMDFAKRSRQSDADLSLIEEFKVALVGENRKPKTIDNYVTALRMFSEFLQPEGVTLEKLLGDADLLKAKKDDFAKVASANSRNHLGGALDVLQRFRAGNPISAPAWVDTQDQPMHPQDKRMIRQFEEAVKAYNGGSGRRAGRVPAPTIKSNVQALRAFARWLLKENKGPLTTRAFNEPKSLALDIEEYTATGGDHRDRLDAALSHLRRLGAEGLQAVGAGPRLMGREILHPYPEDAPTIDGLQDEAWANLGPDATRAKKAPASTMASKLRSFSDWLQRESRGSIMSRISGNSRQKASLDADYKNYVKTTNRTASFDKLRKYLGNAYTDDVSIIDGLVSDDLSKLGSDPASQNRKKTIQNTASYQRSFSDWLQSTGRESIVSRINGTERQRRSLNADYRDFTKATGRTGLNLKKLGQYLRVVEANRALGVAFPEQPSREPRLAGSSPSWSPHVPSGFDPSEWPTPGGPQAGRHETAVSSSTWSPRLPSDFDLNEWPTPEGPQAGRHETAVSSSTWSPRVPSDFDLNEWPTPEGPQAGRHETAVSSSTWSPRMPSDFDLNEWPAPEGPQAGRDETAVSSSTWSPRMPSDFDLNEWPTPEGPQAGRDETAVSSSTWSPRVPSDFDLNEWPTPEGPQAGRHETAVSSSTRSPRVPPDSEASMRPTPEGAPARSSEIYRGLHSFVDLPSTPQETRDDAQSAQVPGPAASPPFFIGPSGEPLELEDIGYLVGEDWQHGSQPVPDFLLDVLDNKMLLPSPRMVPRPVSINGETYSITLGPRGRRDAQFIHHPRPSSVPDAQIGASATSASSHDRGRVLGAREWLGDDHIQRDYEFVAQELRGTNPDLAARTRFVDPLIAFQLNHGADSDALRAFHRIVHDRNGNDTADFLFLPVNNASAIREGDHWSLLLVDRRNQERPVAYHYDSLRGHNDEPAARLAARLGADLQDASMAQQKNGYDCGVFAVDGTRALVRRLAGRRQADLRNLDNLVADRRALQNRLRG
ncbi:Ulp1 family isopeptidase [Mesorhizobium cantuariense]|uniref:Ulp1 family isopeptidase n=1 Tax=Mesorhizobium cantuariense TaxID=1300275 RepID=A0ABV7MGF1_9HYPH